MQNQSSRRTFLKSVSAGAVATSMTAASYANILGANDRISLAIIGCGSRGFKAHMPGVYKHAKSENIEITAVCDPWSLRRDRAAEKTKEWFGRSARKYVTYRDVMAQDDIDAVMIASCDHQHTTHLSAAAKAKKDAYCEKPLARDMTSLIQCVDAVKASKIICQIGTQRRSYSGYEGCKETFKTGVLGSVSRVEQRRNGKKPYWYSRLAPAKKSDVEWNEFLMDAPKRPFDANMFTGWFGYRDYCDGPVPQLGVHFIDLIHHITGVKFPTSAVCQGGVYTWKDDYKFDTPDHVEASWVYPEGFLMSYTTNYGNSSDNIERICGTHGVMNLKNAKAPTVSNEGSVIKGKLGKETLIKPIEIPDHFQNWLQCLRNRKQPTATIDAGYQHSIASIMSVQAMDTGRRQVYDQEQRTIKAG